MGRIAAAARAAPQRSAVTYLPVAALIVFAGFCLRVIRLDSVPPGLTWDEGAEGLDAAALFHGRFPVFFPDNSGHEPALAYIHAASLKILGWNAYALRLPNAFLTTLALALSFAVARKLFGFRVACLAVLLQAATFSQIAMSRMATRAATLEVFTAVVVFFLIRTLRGQDRWRSALLCGLFSGLALYVYTSARFLVVFVALAWLVAMFRSKRAAVLIRGAVLAGAVAALVSAPLALYFVQHPAAFSARAAQVSIFNTALGPVWLNALRAVSVALRMFFLDGEPGWDRDIAHQPYFDPVVAALFFTGIGIALTRWRRDSNALALGWLLVLLAPMVLTSPGWPDFGRAIGIVPVVFFFPAIAAVAIWRRWPATKWLLAPGAIGLLAVASWQYFDVWANAPGTQDSYRPGVLRGAQTAIGRLLAPNPPRYVYFGTPDEYDAVTNFVLAGLDASHPELSPRVLPFTAQNTRIAPPAGSESYDVLDGGAPQASLRTSSNHLAATLGQAVSMAGFDLPASVAPGDTLQLVVQWQPLQPPKSLTFFAHALDFGKGTVLAQLDQNGFPPAEWRGGEIVESVFPLTVPADTPAGAYWVEFGAYTENQQRLPTADGSDHLLLGPFVVAPSVRNVTSATTELGGEIGLSESPVTRAGDGLDVDLHWLPRRTPDRDYTVFVHVIDTSGKLVAQADGPPAQNRWPSRYWIPGLTVDDVHHVRLPAALPSGEYRVIAGLYSPDTGQRLAADPPGPEPGSALVASTSLP